MNKKTQPQNLNHAALTGIVFKELESTKPCLSEAAVEAPKGWTERGWRDIAVRDGGGTIGSAGSSPWRWHDI